jgi:hypothetical protein
MVKLIDLHAMEKYCKKDGVYTSSVALGSGAAR